ncbi:MAG TPA: hypothetical protein DEP72_05610 [Clostridiales bacterium]|nr:MAG: hypothetical protein A2Y18_02700 [Clostridiales bacterium GWD2_32_19]HCC07619.1 hypothetical protein [Clostridiales bacterium]
MLVIKNPFKPKRPIANNDIKPVAKKHKSIFSWVTAWQIIITLMVLAFLILIHPVPERLSKYMVIGCFVISWLIIVFKLWYNFFTRGVVIIATVFIFVTFYGSNKVVVSNELINACYVENLKDYENTKYMSGGENGIGIDSSGLVRRPMIDTFIEMGLLTKNMQYIRVALRIWLDDYAISDIYNNYKDMYIDIQKFSSISEITDKTIKSGDILIYDNCSQVYIYLGNNEWIEVNANDKKTIIVSAIPALCIVQEISGKVVRWKVIDS